jgi:hypothetical protein
VLVAVSVFFGAFCPVGTHALAHEVNSAHIHSHEDGTVHEHEHDAEGHHHDHEMRHTDDVARIAGAGTKFTPSLRVECLAADVSTPVITSSPRLLGAAALDPPLIFPQGLVAPSSAGRAPPA